MSDEKMDAVKAWGDIADALRARAERAEAEVASLKEALRSEERKTYVAMQDTYAIRTEVASAIRALARLTPAAPQPDPPASPQGDGKEPR